MLYSGQYDLSDLAGTIDKITGELAHHVTEFDTIVTRGMSGAIVAPTVAYMLGKRVVIIRKPHDGAHTNRHPGLSYGRQDIGRWIFLDDLVDSGATRRAVYDEIIKRKVSGHYVATYTYDDGSGLGWQGTDDMDAPGPDYEPPADEDDY